MNAREFSGFAFLIVNVVAFANISSTCAGKLNYESGLGVAPVLERILHGIKLKLM